MRMPRGVGALLPAGALAAVAVVAAATVLPVAVADALVVVADLYLIAALTHLVRRTGRVPGLPARTAQFWTSLSYALTAYAAGMAVDLAALVVTAVEGHEIPMYGAQFVYPVAGVITLYAVFRYPTAAQSRPERVRLWLDVSVVLLGAASFMWYFTLSTMSLADAALPVIVLVAGFGVLRVAFAGARVFARSTLALFGTCIVLSGVATAMPDAGPGMPMASTVLLLLAQLAALAGGLRQYRATVSGATRPVGRRRPFSVLPYAASAGAFGLLVLVVGPVLDWRGQGVLAGVGAVLFLVTARQFTALRENSRLLAENEVLTRQLQHQAWHDELTGLPNRAYLARVVERDPEAAVLLIDLDGFKAVNDTLGHAAGDELLCEIAARLVRESGDAVVCRLGGDEFVVLTAAAGPTAGELAERLVRAVGEPVELGGREVRVGASIGVASVSEAPGGAAEVLRRADAAMYAVKAAGKNGWDRARPTPSPGLDQLTGALQQTARPA